VDVDDLEIVGGALNIGFNREPQYPRDNGPKCRATLRRHPADKLD